MTQQHKTVSENNVLDSTISTRQITWPKPAKKHSRETQLDDPDRSRDLNYVRNQNHTKTWQQTEPQQRTEKSRDKTTYKYLVGIKMQAVPQNERSE